MKKFLQYSLVAAAALSATGQMAAQAPGNRMIYGFNLGSAEWKDGTKAYDCGFCAYPFDLSANGTVLRSYLDNPNRAMYAGTGVEGIIYACEYEFTQSTTEPESTDLVAFNTFNGTMERIGKWNPDQTHFKPSDMTYDIKNDKIYAMGYDYGSGIYEVNRETGEFTKVCSLATGGTLACNAKGELFTIDSGGDLYSINLENGKMAKLMSTGLSGMLFNQTMEFDHTTGLLYWASCTRSHPLGAENVWLQEIDLSDLDNITIREVGSLGIQSRFVAMHIPYADSLEAPAAPTEVTSKAGDGGIMAAELSWTNPTTAFGGGDQGQLYGIVIKRDGVQVHYISDPTPGEKMQWTDTSIPERGYYRYDIQAVNAKGNGGKGTAFQFVGADVPAGVENIKGKLADDMSSITLTWEAPKTGAHLGAFNPAECTYTVVRNDNVTVATDITECTITDNDFVRLLNYSYTIIAKNAEGESSTVSPSFIIGPAQALPLDQTFENEAQVRNRWTIVDGNADTYSWLFATDLGHAIFGDYELCAEYITSPTLGNSEDADEWLISPPLKLEANTEYMVLVSARSYSSIDGTVDSEETLDVMMGKQNTVEAMTEKIGTLMIGANDADETTGTMAFVEQAAIIPESDEDQVRCVGLHLVSPLMRAGFLQINAIYIGENDGTGVENISLDAPEALFSLTGRTLLITGKFSNAALYDMQGMKAASITSAITDLGQLPKGIYVLSIDGRASKLILK